MQPVLAVLLGSMGSILLSCALCVHSKRGSKLPQGDPVTLVCRPASAGLARLSTCRIVLPTTLLQHTNLCDTARLRCVLNMNACSFLAVQSHSRVLWRSAPLPLTYPDPRENVDRPHQRTCMLCVACVEPQHSGSVRLATSVCGPRDWEYPLLYSPYFLPSPSPRNKCPTQKIRLNDGWLTFPNTILDLAPPFTYKIQLLGSFVTPKKDSHLTSSGHRSPATAVHYAKRA
jgi:hypothetical protein